MRPIERIDNFISKVDIEFLANRWGLEHGFLLDILGWDNSSKFTNYWKENSDQRIGQVLINLGLIPDNFKAWNDEEEDILVDQELAPEEYLLWTSVYDKDGNLLEKPITRLIKDLEINHIKRILKLYSKNISENYKKGFDNILQKYLPGITYNIE
jgi:hypothetical protein